MKRVLVVIGVVLAAAAMAGCDAMAVGSSYEVTVVNESSDISFDDMNISDSSASTWGEDQLPPDTIVDPGDTIVLESVRPISTPESVDVRIKYLYDPTFEMTATGLDITKTIYIRDSGISN